MTGSMCGQLSRSIAMIVRSNLCAVARREDDDLPFSYRPLGL